MAPGLCSMIKVEDVSDPLTETPDRVSEAVLLFCQVRLVISKVKIGFLSFKTNLLIVPCRVLILNPTNVALPSKVYKV